MVLKLPKFMRIIRGASACIALTLLVLTTGCELIGGLLPCSGLCAAGEFCKRDVGDCDTNEGVCTTIPDACTQEVDPVCGCDGNTYSNACEAEMSAVSVAATGECEDDSTPGVGDFCGGIAGVACSDDLYCQFPEGTCGAADQSGTCMEIPDVCTEIFAPVCGCDDQTYANACLAAVDSVSILSQGECN